MISLSSIGSIIAAGACFMLANLALKLLGDKPWYVLYPVVAVIVIAGCWFEIMAFRQTQFGLVVVLILGLEMLFSILVARAFLGETYSSTNMIGVMLVIAGMGLVHVPAGSQAVAKEERDVFKDAEIRKGPRPGSADSDGKG